MPGENPLHAGQAVSGGHQDSGTTGSATRARWRGRAGLLLAGSILAGPLLGGVACAQGAEVAAGLSVSTIEVMQLAVFAGVMGAAFLSAIVLIRERARIS